MQNLFSQRHSFTDIPELQLDDISTTLKTRIWNTIDKYILKKDPSPLQNDLFYSIWSDFLKQSINDLSGYWSDYHQTIYLNYFQLEWHEIYSFLEFIIAKKPDDIDLLIYYINNILEEENSGYRIIDKTIAPITDSSQIQEIEKTLNSPIIGTREHLQNALEKLSDKNKPDYRNSIKESISAVESMSKFYSQKKSATLGDLIMYIDKKSSDKIPPTLKEAFKKLYGYTNEEKGIRHGMLDKSKLSFHDALFMLVVCSAFINYCEQVLGGVTN